MANSQLLKNPGIWFIVALCGLFPWYVVNLANNEWFARLPKPVGDGLDYENLAYHVWRGRGYVIDTADQAWRVPYESERELYALHLDAAPRTLIATGRPPLFPTLVAGVYALQGRSPLGFASVRVMLAACLAIAGALAVSLSVRLLARYSIAAVICGAAATLLLAASNRTLLTYCTDFLTEPLALLLTQTFVSLAVFLATRPADGSMGEGRAESMWVWSAKGLLLGGMILTRSMFVLWMPALMLMAVGAATGTLRTRMQRACWMTLCACLVCLPWWTRNVMVLDEWMPLGTQGKIALVGGYCDAAVVDHGEWQFEPEQELRLELLRQPEFRAASGTRQEVLVARAAGARVAEWVQHNWDALPGLVAARVRTHWNPYSGPSLLWKLAALVGAVCLLIRRERAAIWLLGLPLLSTCVVAGLYTTGGRFLVPLYGVLFTLAGVAVAELIQIISQRLNRQRHKGSTPPRSLGVA